MNPVPKRVIKARSTCSQLKILVDYMALNRRFAYGDASGKKDYAAKWQALAELLAKHGPPKTVDQWKTSWKDLKKNARRHRNKTSSAKKEGAPEINELHERVLSILGYEEAFSECPTNYFEASYDESFEARENSFFQNLVVYSKDDNPECKTTDDHFEPEPKNIREDVFTTLTRCFVNLVKKGACSLSLFDEPMFREVMDLIPMMRSEKERITSEYIETFIQNDVGGRVDQDTDVDGSQDGKPKKRAKKFFLVKKGCDDTFQDVSQDGKPTKMLSKNFFLVKKGSDGTDTTMDKTDGVTGEIEVLGGHTPLLIKGEVETVLCTCGRDTEGTMTSHSVDCTAADQTFLKFFEVSSDSATCHICNGTVAWTDRDTLKQHLQTEHPDTLYIIHHNEEDKGETSNEDSSDLRYLEENVSDPETSMECCKKRRKKSKVPLQISGPMTREKIAASLQRLKSLDNFGPYVVSLLKSIPKEKSIKFQIEMVERLLQEQAAAG